MGGRFEKLIAAALAAGALTLAGCDAGGGGAADPDPAAPQPEPEPGPGPALQTAVAYFLPVLRAPGNTKGAFLPETVGTMAQANTVQLTFVEAVQVTDAAAAAAAFTLAETVATRAVASSFQGSVCYSPTAEGGCGGSPVPYTSVVYTYVAPFQACLSATGSMAVQCAGGPLRQDGSLGRTNYLSMMVPEVRVSAADPRNLILDYTAAGGFLIQHFHSALAFRLRYTNPDTHPVQDMEGDALAAFNFPSPDMSGNVNIALVGNSGSGSARALAPAAADRRRRASTERGVSARGSPARGPAAGSRRFGRRPPSPHSPCH